MRAGGITVLVCLGLVGGAHHAAAGDAAAPPVSYDALADGATRLARAGLADWAWAVSAKCTAGDALAQRQCRVIRAARAGQVRAATFVVRADPSAFQVGAWDPAKKSLPITLHGCLACSQPVDVGGKKLFLDARPTGGAAAPAGGAVIHQSARVFADRAAAEAWKKDVVPRLRVELVVRVPDGDPVWHRGGRDGVGVTVLGYRVYDPCDGGIVCASPTATKVAADLEACGKTVEAGPADGGGGDAPVEKIVDRLEPWMIQQAMAPAVAVTQKCLDTYGVTGTAKLRMTITGDGNLAALELRGDFAHTPTGACITDAVKGVTFPRSHKSRTTITYPIMLR
jgi:hypothetical protein